MILFLSHGERGHASLAAGIASQICPDQTILAGELGSRHQFGLSFYEKKMAEVYPDLGIGYPSRVNPSMIEGAEYVLYMDDEDKIRIEKVVPDVKPPKFRILVKDGVPTLLDGWSNIGIWQIIVDATRAQMEEICG